MCLMPLPMPSGGMSSCAAKAGADHPGRVAAPNKAPICCTCSRRDRSPILSSLRIVVVGRDDARFPAGWQSPEVSRKGFGGATRRLPPLASGDLVVFLLVFVVQLVL